ncbi:MAG: tRNA (adenosine(37)-N6)-threonylcarbamoyltransferase complex transferase subunit TsaD [Candidatus Shapirobacteria bacterium]|jgi:N6-L-threonylcarbamoyladenine synthase
MKILGIETSCDDTCAAVLIDDRVISNVISSQTDLHKDWGGVVPDIAKRAHQARIMPVIMTALKRARITIEEIDVIAVTKGPGLAIALSIGVNTAKELAIKYNKKLVAVNHIEGHVLSNLVKNQIGKPDTKIVYPALCLTASGGHTKIISVEGIGRYVVVGETLDDAAGEALDKAAKLLGLGYPGGPVIERIAKGHKTDFIPLPKPLADKKILDYSFSGLKTSFYYKIKDWPKVEVDKNLGDLAATFQESVFDTLLRKFDLAIDKYQPKTLMASGGVLANMELRKKLRRLAKKKGLPILMPVKKWLNTDNASMIGLVGYYKAKRKEFEVNINELDRDPRYEI